MASSLVPESPLKVLAYKWLLCCWNAGCNNDADADADMMTVLMMMIVAENKYQSCRLLQANSKLFITWHSVLLSFHDTITQEQHTHTLWFLRWNDCSLLACPRWHSYLLWLHAQVLGHPEVYQGLGKVISHLQSMVCLLTVVSFPKSCICRGSWHEVELPFFLEMLYLYRKYQNETE